MENLIVRKLTDSVDDQLSFEDFIQEHVGFEKEYLADNSSKTNKKYMEFKRFSDWYKRIDKNSTIYLVIKQKYKKESLVGTFEIGSFENQSTIFMDIRPTEREKGYEAKIINFIRNICVIKDMHEIKVVTSVPKIKVDYSERDNTTGIFTLYDIEKEKVLTK